MLRAAADALQFGLANRVVAHDELAAAGPRHRPEHPPAPTSPRCGRPSGSTTGAGAPLAEAIDTEIEVATKWVVDLSNFGVRER